MNHSLVNAMSTILGFVFGAVNTIVLATNYLPDDYHGVWGYVLSMAFILFPLMSFGVHNTVVKYYSRLSTKLERDAFFTQMILWPLLVIVPSFLLLWIFQAEAVAFITRENAINRDFLWTIPLIAVFQAYFELFYAWQKVHLKTRTGNFLKEVFYRIGATILLLMFIADWITAPTFIYALVVVYFLRMSLMLVLALKTYSPQWRWQKIYGVKDIFTYSLFMIVAGSVGTALLDLDKAMLNQYVTIENITYFNVAVFIATVVAVPARGMAQIMFPLVSQYIAKQQDKDLAQIYKSSAQQLCVLSGLLFLVITTNVEAIYAILPPEHHVAIPVVLCISLMKLIESCAGCNNAILYNSDLYKVTLWMGLALVLIASLLNIWLIPIYGLLGAALATSFSFIGYSLCRIWYVYFKMNIHPLTKELGYTLTFVGGFYLLFAFWQLPVNPFVAIIIKSLLIVLLFVFMIVKTNINEELTQLLTRYLKKSK